MPIPSPSTAPAPRPNPPTESTDSDIKNLFDPRPDTSLTSPAQSTNLIVIAFQRIAAAFSEAAAWVMQVFSRNSQVSPPLMKVSAPPQLPANGAAAKITNRNAEDLDAAAKSAASPHSIKPVHTPPPDSPSSRADKNREAFDTYLRLTKDDPTPPGAAMIPQNFEEGAVAHANAIVDEVLEAKKKAEAEGSEFYLPSEKQENLNIAVRILEQQKDDSATKDKAADARFASHVPTNTAQQVSSFMAWRECKKTPASLATNKDFSFDAALEYAHEVLAQNASKDAAKQPEVKALLNDAIELIAKADEIRDKYENARLIANLLSSAEAARAEPKGISPAQTETLGTPAQQARIESQSGRGMPPPPPPPRVRPHPQASTVSLPETPLPTTPPPAAPAPRKQNLAYLVGQLPAWSGKQLIIIASAASPLSSDQVGRAMQGLRSIDWAAGAASIATPSGTVVDERQRLMNYDRQQEVANYERAETLEYASMLLRNLSPEHLKDREFGALLKLHAKRDELSARIDAELQALRPPKTAPAKKKN